MRYCVIAIDEEGGRVTPHSCRLDAAEEILKLRREGRWPRAYAQPWEKDFR